MESNGRPQSNSSILKVFETLPYRCLVLSSDLTILTASNAYLHVTGKVRDEIVGRYIFDVFPIKPNWSKDTDGGIAFSLEQVLQTKQQHELPVMRFDIPDPENPLVKIERHWKTIHTPVLDHLGRILYIIHDTTDVTEQVISEQHLRESLILEKRATAKAELISGQMERLFHEIPAQIAIATGPDLVYEYINPQYKKELFPNRDVLGFPLLTALPEIEGKPILAILQEVYASKETFIENEIHMRLADEAGGTLKDHYFNVVYQPLKNETGEINGILSFKYEITTHVAARKLLEQREKELIMLYEKLNMAYDQLQESNEKLNASSEELRATNEELITTNEELYKAHEGLVRLNEHLEERVQLRTSELQLFREEAESQRDRLHFLLNAIPQQVWTATPQGSLNYVNDVVCSNFGSNSEQILAGGLMGFVHPEDLAGCMLSWQQAFKSGGEYHAEFRLKFADGVYRWHLARAVPMIKNEKVSLWLGTNTDIELQKSNELKKDEFLSIASHELKTPLTSIKSFNQLMAREHHTGQLATYIQKSNNNIIRLEKLISDLLDVTRINAGKMLYDMQSFDFTQMLKETIESVQLTAPTHQIRLECSEGLMFTGDRLRLEQVLINLLNNAIKYSPAAKEVAVNVKFEEAHIIVSVQDFGIGIEKQHLYRLFERYYRTDNAHMRFEGLGLGLFIASEIIKRHFGSFWIDSELGSGSSFCFRLPLEPERQAQAVMDDTRFYKDEQITIVYNDAAHQLESDWTGFQNMESVQKGGMKMLELLMHNQVYKLLNDNTHVEGTWSEAAEWVAQELIPDMENAGLKFIAWIHSPSAFSRLSAEKSADLALGNVVTQFFTDRPSAEKWLKTRYSEADT